MRFRFHLIHVQKGLVLDSRQNSHLVIRCLAFQSAVARGSH